MSWFKIFVGFIWFFGYAYLAVNTYKNRKASDFPIWPRCVLEPKYSFHSLLIEGAGYKVTAYVYWIFCIVGTTLIIVLPT